MFGEDEGRRAGSGGGEAGAGREGTGVRIDRNRELDVLELGTVEDVDLLDFFSFAGGCGAGADVGAATESVVTFPDFSNFSY